MRIWFLPFEEMADLHVLGQHKEWGLMHAMLNSPRFVKHPLVTFFKDKKHWLADLHDRVVEEMDHRYDHFHRNGHVHGTPVPEGYMDGLCEWVPPRSFVLYDMIDVACRYMIADKDQPGKYKWSHRPRPEWTQDRLALRIKRNQQPIHQIGWYGEDQMVPFQSDHKTRQALEEWERRYGWLIDAWYEHRVFCWPYFGCGHTIPWRTE